MATLTIIKDEEKLLVSANDLFAAMKRKDEYRSWLADRITSFDMEEGHDFFIYMNIECVREMLKYESAPYELKEYINRYSLSLGETQ
jgi:phage anti-repressor protein